MSGWSPRASPTCLAWAGVGATRSTQTAAFGLAEQVGQRGERRLALQFVDVRRRRAPRPGWSRAGRPARSRAWRRTRAASGTSALAGQRARPGSGGSKPSAAGPSRSGGSASSSIRARSRRLPPRVRLGGMATAVTAGRDDEQPDHDRRRLARRPGLERADDQRVAQRPVAQGLGDELLVGVGRRVDLVVQPVDGRRAVGGQDRQPDRHARASGRPSRPPTPSRTRAGRRPPRRRSSAASRSARTRARRRRARARRSRGSCPASSATSRGGRRCSARCPPRATTRSGTTRTMKPDTSAPTAVAPASAPSASRCSSGPPYRTRSTKTAPPMIAVANA